MQIDEKQKNENLINFCVGFHQKVKNNISMMFVYIYILVANHHIKHLVI
jgi:hypothetical protein